MRVQEYILTEDFNVGGDKVLPKGAFVKPIHPYYLPKHIKDSKDYSTYLGNSYMQEHIYCYTRYGIVPIPESKIREL